MFPVFTLEIDYFDTEIARVGYFGRIFTKLATFRTAVRVDFHHMDERNHPNRMRAGHHERDEPKR